MVKCFANAGAHAHGDKSKSCSVSLETGQWSCKTCGLSGGPYDAALSQGIEKREAAELAKKFGLWVEKPGEANTEQKPARRRERHLEAVPDGEQKGERQTPGPRPKPSKPSDGFTTTEDDVAAYAKRLLSNAKVLKSVGELRGWTAQALETLGCGWDGDKVTFPIRNANGELVGCVRYQPDPSKRGEEKPKSKADSGSTRDLFPAPEIIDTAGFLFLVEGEPDAVGGQTVTIPTVGYPGTGGWQSEWSARFEGRKVCIVLDADRQGRERARSIAHDLFGIAGDVRLLDLHPDKDDGSDLTDFLRSIGAEADRTAASQLLRDMGERAPRYSRGATGAAPKTLHDVVEAYRKWLFLPDLRPLLSVLGAVAANYLDGPPVCLLLVGPSGGGKTALVEPLRVLPNMHEVSTMTVGSLLSGTSRRERAKDASGGLLMEMGRFGIMLCKDFTSVLSEHPLTRDEALAALREVYDGRWTRWVGTEGGRKLEWPPGGGKGKMGIVGGVTEAIEGAQTVAQQMGERLLLLRLETASRWDLTMAALEQGRRQDERDEELAAAVAGLFAYGPPRDPQEPTLEEKESLAALAMLCAYCRSGVVRDRQTHEIEVVYEPEVPSRLVQALAQLLAGLSSIGVPRAMARAICAKVAIDSAPTRRSAVLSALLGWGDAFATTTDVARELGMSDTQSIRRALQELNAHRVVEVNKGGQGKADEWRVEPWARAYAEHMSIETAGTVRDPLAAEKPLAAVKGSELPENLLQTALSGRLRPPLDETFSATFIRGGRSNGKSPNGDTPPRTPPPRQLSAAEKVGANPHGQAAEAPMQGSPQSVSAGERSLRAWLLDEGWKMGDEALELELRKRSAGDAEVIELVDLAYDRRREEGDE